MESPTEKAENNFLANLPVEQQLALRAQIAEICTDVVSKVLPRALQEGLLALRSKTGVTERVTNLLDELSQRWDDTPEMILLQGLLLYRHAMEAKGRGNHLVEIGPDDVIVTELVDVGPEAKSIAAGV